MFLFASLAAVLAQQWIPTNTRSWISQYQQIPQASSVSGYLEDLTSRAHVAGTPEQLVQTVDYLKAQYSSFNLSVDTQYFQSMLNFPIHREVQLLGPTEFNCSLVEPSIPEDPTSVDPKNADVWNGFGPSGEATAELVYANYGTASDFQYLKDQGVDLTGKIVIVRYGNVFRGVKVFNAAAAGAAGVLIYSDPQDDGSARGAVYPDGPWRPADGAQRGSVLFIMVCPGDPRRTQLCFGTDDVNYNGTLIPAIPVQPMSWTDAQPLLQAISGGPPLPSAWQGGLGGFTYSIGPGPALVHMLVENQFRVSDLCNVLVTIPGTETPDEYVVLGSHMDAWVYGAVDPTSGTAASIETGRALSLLMQSGWRPKRTIVIAAWDGEEYGLIGSTHFVENCTYLDKIVAYFNFDSTVMGPNFHAAGTPSLYSFVQEVTTLLTDPTTNNTVAQQWGNGGFGVLGSGSDYTAFIHHAGVPSIDLAWSGPYGVYHSVYDSYTWISKFGDPAFLYHRLAAQTMGTLLIAAADSPVLPFNYTQTASALQTYLQSTIQLLASYTPPPPVDLAHLTESINNFQSTAIKTYNKIVVDAIANNQSLTSYVPLNRWLYETEKSFLDPQGLPNRIWYKHTIQAPGLLLGYGYVIFPGLTEAIQAENWTLANEQAEIVSIHIQAAADYLAEYEGEDDDDNDTTLVIVLVCVIIGAVILLGIACYYYRKRRQQHQSIDLTKGYDALEDTNP